MMRGFLALFARSTLSAQGRFLRSAARAPSAGFYLPAQAHARDRRWPRRQRFIDCLEAIMRERNSNSRMRHRSFARTAVLTNGLWRTAFGGDRDAVVLDFEFRSRSAPPSKQWRHPHSWWGARQSLK
jgi:hypothetical protein